MIKVEPVTSSELNERLAYSVDEVAAITGLSRDLLCDQMRAGKLAYLKIGRRRIITRQHLEAFLTGATLPICPMLGTDRLLELRRSGAAAPRASRAGLLPGHSPGGNRRTRPRSPRPQPMTKPEARRRPALPQA